MKKSYEVICEVKDWDTPEQVELKNKMKNLYIKQEKFEEKYKCVRQYAECGYEINQIKYILKKEN
ncbi:hypothetical protein [Paenibacillus sp. Mc5Re-14]|uniref:hypothetical protein n=1 Tax=Paenibacillus sp. Mc5Re-14 TaxID=1030529 RepID=UPI000A55A6AF|nr:hypothetical protein [Paenibacillus sp. Mc5Re-14]